MAWQSSNALSRLASRIMQGAQATQKEIMQLAGSVLSQDETKGSRTSARKAKKRKASTRKASTRTAPAKKKRAAKKRK
jgi:hypothetical protein